MTPCSKIAATITILCGLSAIPSSAHAELQQFSCELDNNYVAFILRESSEMGTVGARQYIVDFQPGGPAIRLSPTYYAPDWNDIEDIRFQFLDADSGRLSLRVRSAPRPAYAQPIGIVQRACWEAAKKFLADRNIAVHISELGKRSNLPQSRDRP